MQGQKRHPFDCNAAQAHLYIYGHGKADAQCYSHALPLRLVCIATNWLNMWPPLCFQEMSACQQWFVMASGPNQFVHPHGKSLCIPCANGLGEKLY